MTHTFARTLIVGALALFGMATPAQNDEVSGTNARVWNFDGQVAGEAPSGWRIAETNGDGSLAPWTITADASAPSSPNALVVGTTHNSGQTYNVALATGTEYKNVVLSVKVKAGTGTEDQGGGPVWRAKDPNNYYLARWNPLENNVRVYVVKDGKRKMLGSVKAEADASTWHEIRVEAKNSSITVEFDGKVFVEAQDDSLPDAGMVGLWTKADASTSFDDLRVAEAGE